MPETACLVVDGQDAQEDGEGLLVEHLARRIFRHVVRLPYFPASERAWTMTWFSGHTSLYRSKRLASLETRRGSSFYRVGTLAGHRSELLVLSSCVGLDPRADWDVKGARWVISHQGALTHTSALVFAACFVPLLRVWRAHLLEDNVQAAFHAARRASASRGWRFRP